MKKIFNNIILQALMFTLITLLMGSIFGFCTWYLLMAIKTFSINNPLWTGLIAIALGIFSVFIAVIHFDREWEDTK